MDRSSSEFREHSSRWSFDHLRDLGDRWRDARTFRGTMAAVTSVALAWFLLRAFGKTYPISTWLVWVYLRAWGFCLLETVACLSLGHLLLSTVIGAPRRPLLETLVVSQTIGVVAFCVLLHAAGALGLYRAGPMLGLVVAMLLSGLPGLLRTLRSDPDQVRSRGAASRFVGLLATLFGVVGVTFVYLQVMTPAAINFDAGWCHLSVAQDYAREGRLIAFPGDYARNHPQLASVLHTWGWVMPGAAHPAERWILALHQEFVILLWTLVGVSAVAQALLDDPRARHAWAAFFLFPSIFVYDSNLGGAADHYLAFFAPGVFLGTLRFLLERRTIDLVVVAIAGGGALLTKYQASYLLAPAAALIGCALLLGLARAIRGGARWGPALLAAVRGPVVAAGVFAGVVAPHFLRNWVFYRNPVFPFAQSFFTSTTPRTPDAALLVEFLHKDPKWVPTGTFLEKLKSSAALAFSFHLEPHYSFTNNVPNFGSLFIFTLPLLLFVRRPGRAALGAVFAWLSVFVWAYTFRVDRNLQALVPVMAAVTATLLVRAWELGALSRLGLGCLVGVQIAWGGDALVYSGHSRIADAINLVKSGFEGKRGKERYHWRTEFLELDASLPKEARVVLHYHRQNLGMDRPAMLDHAGGQGLFAYERTRQPAEVWEMLRAGGATHVLASRSAKAAANWQTDVVFLHFIREIGPPRRFGPYDLYALPEAPPPSREPLQVVVAGHRHYPSGLYAVDALSVYEALPPQHQRWPKPAAVWPKARGEQGALLARADAVVVGPRGGIGSDLLAGFDLAAQFPKAHTVYLRKGPRTAPAPQVLGGDEED